MTKNTAAATKHESGRKPSTQMPSTEVSHQVHPLDRRYGAIGISAVAAALRYQSEVKNPAYAPVVHQLDNDAIDAVA